MTLQNILTFPHDPATTEKVQVAGSFSYWNPVEMTYNTKTNTWELDLYRYLRSTQPESQIIGSTYTYKFILNGDNWCCNILEPTVKDEFGNDNHEITISEYFETEDKSATPDTAKEPHVNGNKDPDSDPETRQTTEETDDVESIDDNAVAEQISGLFGLFQWLFDWIMALLFGTKPKITDSSK